ncbi:hypothetical protein LUZ60_009143 [Juncus effusus]|nr:hypothetical protein LUZ60_009143 [Juncus effusus]
MKLSILIWLAFFVGVQAQLPFFPPYTNSEDVYAINELYNALGSPALSGWSAFGGDPCSEAWQGVQCINNNISAIVLVGLNLGGKLGDSLANFTSITLLDLSNNHVGGAISENWPSTLQKLYLSGNNLSGQLPTSIENLTSLTILHLQNNALSGTLDVLQNLPLKELNVANNQFSGSIPAKLLNIPNFKSDGNSFNANIPTISPSSNQPSTNSSINTPQQESNAPIPAPLVPLQIVYHEKKVTAGKAISYAIAIVSSLIIVLLLVRFLLSKLKERKSERIDDNFFNRLEVMSHENTSKHHFANSLMPSMQITQETAQKAKEQKVNLEEDVISLEFDSNQINLDEIVTSPKRQKALLSAQAFSVASLQQYTNSFSKDNLIKEGSSGKVYLAEQHEQKLYAVLKIDKKIEFDDFMAMVESISEVKHPNIVELVGYCAEYGQRLLVYNYFSETTLHDILHSHNDPTTSVPSWIRRILIALKTAKVLQYLQESGKKHIIHQHFETRNILLDDELEVRVFGCGLFSLLSQSELQSYCPNTLSYEAPEVTESGLWSDKSDIYNFGVVMLELLTGREPYDSSQTRAERHLAKWAASQLYDIDALVKMVDPSLEGRFPVRSLSRIADIISRCIQEVPEFRPSMSEIVQDLSLALDEASRRTE